MQLRDGFQWGATMTFVVMSACAAHNLSLNFGERIVLRPTPRRRELRAAMRAAIAEELRQLYRCRQDDPIPDRLAQLVRELDGKMRQAVPAASKSESDAN
jgi:hypothetical protein